MGLDTTHDAWHGSYGGFGRWRNEVAMAAGYEIKRVTHEDGWSADEVQIDWDQIVPKNYDGEWDENPSDPLIILIAHSDCDGVIHPEQAAALADRLEGLELPNEGSYTRWSRDGRGPTQQFIDGLRAAVEAGEDVEFH